MTKEKPQKTYPATTLTRERVLTFRVDFDQLDALKRTARSNGVSVSRLIRDAVQKIGVDK